MLSFLFESTGRPDAPGPAPLKPTLRQGMIVVLWSALLVAAVRAMISWGLLGGPPETPDPDDRDHDLGLAGDVALPPLARVRSARARQGLARRCCPQIGCSYLGIASFLLLEPACLAWTGRTSMIFPLFSIMGLFGAWANTMHLRSIWPKRCDRCGSRAVIATGKYSRPIRPDWRAKILGRRARPAGTAFEKGHATTWSPRPEMGDEP